MDDLIFEFIFEFVFESVFGSFIDGFVGALSAVILPLAVILLLFYFYHAFTWRQIGQKAGLEEDWMPFIPIARSLYRRLSEIDPGSSSFLWIAPYPGWY